MVDGLELGVRKRRLNEARQSRVVQKRFEARQRFLHRRRWRRNKGGSGEGRA
jgi:hypothetical protein